MLVPWASDFEVPTTEDLDADVRIAQELGPLGRRRPARAPSTI